MVKVIGEEHETAEFEKKLKEIEAYASKYNKLTEEAIIDLARERLLAVWTPRG